MVVSEITGDRKQVQSFDSLDVNVLCLVGSRLDELKRVWANRTIAIFGYQLRKKQASWLVGWMNLSLNVFGAYQKRFTVIEQVSKRVGSHSVENGSARWLDSSY